MNNVASTSSTYRIKINNYDKWDALRKESERNPVGTGGVVDPEDLRTLDYRIHGLLAFIAMQSQNGIWIGTLDALNAARHSDNIIDIGEAIGILAEKGYIEILEKPH